MELGLHHKLILAGDATAGRPIARGVRHWNPAGGRQSVLAGVTVFALWLTTLAPPVPGDLRWREPVVAEWPAQKLVYVADGHRLRVFRLGLGLAPLADVALPVGHSLLRLELDAETGFLTLVLGDGKLVLDGKNLKPLP